MPISTLFCRCRNHVRRVGPFSLRRSNRTNQVRAQRLALEPLEQRLALSGFEVETPPILDPPRVPFFADGVISPGEWEVGALAFDAQGPGVLPVAVAVGDANQDTSVRTVVRVDAAGYSRLTTLYEFNIPGPLPAGAWVDKTIVTMSFVGFTGDNGDEPHAANDDTLLNVLAIGREPTAVTPFPITVVVDTNDDGTPDASIADVGMDMGFNVDTDDPDTIKLTVEIAFPLNVREESADPEGPLHEQVGTFENSFVTASVADSNGELVQAAGYLVQINDRGLAAATSDDVPQGTADADLLRVNRNRVEIAILSTPNFFAADIDVGTLKVKAFADGKFLGFLTYETKLKDVNKDGITDLVLNHDATSNPGVIVVVHIIHRDTINNPATSSGLYYAPPFR